MRACCARFARVALARAVCARALCVRCACGAPVRASALVRFARARLARAPRLCAVSRPRRFGCRDALSAADSHLFVSFNHSKEERFVLVVMVHKPKNTG